MKDFDVILGMDWLGRNNATIRCREKEVFFQKPGEEQFSFPGIGFCQKSYYVRRYESIVRKC